MLLSIAMLPTKDHDVQRLPPRFSSCRVALSLHDSERLKTVTIGIVYTNLYFHTVYSITRGSTHSTRQEFVVTVHSFAQQTMTLLQQRLPLLLHFAFTITLLSISLTRVSCFLHGKRTLAAAFMSPSRDYRLTASTANDNETTSVLPEQKSTAAANDEEIVLPERKYGYASQPFTWPDLTEIIDGDEPNLAKLSRSVQQQRDYMIYTRNMLKEWKTVYDHILVSKFGLGKRLVKNLWEAYPPLSEVSEPKKVLCVNDFPYYMAAGIEHWCLWKLCQDIEDDEVDEAKEELRRMHGSDLEFLCWRNPPHLKSLPDIDHYHFLIRRAEEPPN